MSGIVGVKTVTILEVTQNRRAKQWVRNSEIYTFWLKATKGWRKAGPVRRHVETATSIRCPKGWRRGRWRKNEFRKC